MCTHMYIYIHILFYTPSNLHCNNKHTAEYMRLTGICILVFYFPLFPLSNTTTNTQRYICDICTSTYTPTSVCSYSIFLFFSSPMQPPTQSGIYATYVRLHRHPHLCAHARFFFLSLSDATTIHTCINATYVRLHIHPHLCVHGLLFLLFSLWHLHLVPVRMGLL